MEMCGIHQSCELKHLSFLEYYKKPSRKKINWKCGVAAETSVHDAEDNPGCCRSDTLHLETSSSNGFLLCASCCVSESGSLMDD